MHKSVFFSFLLSFTHNWQRTFEIWKNIFYFTMVFSQFVYKMNQFSLTKTKTKKKKNKSYALHLNVHISIQSTQRKKYKNSESTLVWMASLPKISVARSLAHLSRSLSCGFMSRAAAAATGVSSAMKWFPAYGHSQSRPLSAKAQTDKTKAY